MFYGNYAVEISVGERKIFLKTKPCAPLQIDEIRVSYSSVGVISRIQIGRTRVLSISDPHFVSFSDESLGHKIFYPGRISVLLQVSTNISPYQ